MLNEKLLNYISRNKTAINISSTSLENSSTEAVVIFILIILCKGWFKNAKLINDFNGMIGWKVSTSQQVVLTGSCGEYLLTVIQKRQSKN